MAYLVASLALLFTVFSFWWINARPGRLRMTEVRLFACYVQRDDACLRLPVALYNTGALPLVVVDLRLRASSGDVESMAATRTLRKTLEPKKDDVADFPRPYAVLGRTVVTEFVEFSIDPDVMVTLRPLEVEVEALIDRKGWRSVGRSIIRTDIVGDPGAYITYSNEPTHWPEGQERKAQDALSKLRAELKQEAST